MAICLNDGLLQRTDEESLIKDNKNRKFYCTKMSELKIKYIFIQFQKRKINKRLLAILK